MDTNEQPTDPKADERKGTVDPVDSPVPSNPPVDEEAVEKGEDVLGRVKPY